MHISVTDLSWNGQKNTHIFTHICSFSQWLNRFNKTHHWKPSLEVYASWQATWGQCVFLDASPTVPTSVLVEIKDIEVSNKHVLTWNKDKKTLTARWNRTAIKIPCQVDTSMQSGWVTAQGDAFGWKWKEFVKIHFIKRLEC